MNSLPSNTTMTRTKKHPAEIIQINDNYKHNNNRKESHKTDRMKHMMTLHAWSR